MRHSITCNCGPTILIDSEELRAAIKTIRKTLGKQLDEEAGIDSEKQRIFMPDEIEKAFDQMLFRKPSQDIQIFRACSVD